MPWLRTAATDPIDFDDRGREWNVSDEWWFVQQIRRGRTPDGCGQGSHSRLQLGSLLLYEKSMGRPPKMKREYCPIFVFSLSPVGLMQRRLVLIPVIFVQFLYGEHPID